MAVYTTVNDPSTFFQAMAYSGNGSNLSVTNDGNANLQPDFVWIKRRDGSGNHALTDSTRGGTNQLRSNTDAGQSQYGNVNMSFNSDGFSSSGSTLNDSGQTYIGWQWKANGGTTSSNASGSINSTVQANTAAGFSIVSYVGNAVNGASVGHGLTAVPQMIIFKRTDGSRNWMVYHQATGPTKALFLDLTAATDTDSVYFSNTAPTSGIFYLGTNNKGNGDGTAYIAYCFAEKQGYSKFGSYTGNGNADGAFIYTGFKPAFILVKRSSAVQSWVLWDNKRDGFNQTNKSLSADESSGEETRSVDILSNGFKQRQNNTATNASGSTYIYMAFAANPFVTSDGVPTTAK